VEQLLLAQGEEESTELALVEQEKHLLQALKKSPAVFKQSLGPSACAKFLSAFSQAELFDMDVFQELERSLVVEIEKIGLQADSVSPLTGPHLVMAFEAHSTWCEHLLKETLEDKKQKRRFAKHFSHYNNAFNKGVIEELTKRAHSQELNLKAILKVMHSARYAYLKKRENVRSMRQFAMASISSVVEEVAVMVEQESKLRDAARMEGQEDEEKYVALLDHIQERELLR